MISKRKGVRWQFKYISFTMKDLLSKNPKWSYSQWRIWFLITMFGYFFCFKVTIPYKFGRSGLKKQTIEFIDSLPWLTGMTAKSTLHVVPKEDEK
jgi:hypothetical protein